MLFLMLLLLFKAHQFLGKKHINFWGKNCVSLKNLWPYCVICHGMETLFRGWMWTDCWMHFHLFNILNIWVTCIQKIKTIQSTVNRFPIIFFCSVIFNRAITIMKRNQHKLKRKVCRSWSCVVSKVNFTS